MSRQQATKQQRSKQCTFCMKAGEAESVYKSHFIRESPDPNSKVVCPLLLATICPNCDKLGHTYKNCPKTLADEKDRKRREYKLRCAEADSRAKKAEAEAKKNSTNEKSLKKCGNFAALMDSSDDEDDEKPKKTVQKHKSAAAVVVAPIKKEKEPVNKNSYQDLFPALPTTGFKSAKSTESALALLTQDGLTMAEKIKAYVPPVRRSISRSVQIAQPVNKIINDTTNDDDDDWETAENMMPSYYEKALKKFNDGPKISACDLDWAATEDDSSDEDDDEEW